MLRAYAVNASVTSNVCLLPCVAGRDLKPGLFGRIGLVLAFVLGLAQPDVGFAQDTQKPDLEAMIGQMLIVGFAGTSPDNGDVESLAYQIRHGIIGGVILLKRNVKSPRQLSELTQYLQDASGEYPLFIGIDQEGGRVQRLTSEAGFSEWASAAEVARRSAQDASYARLYYTDRAAELHELHINLNFGPVVDLNVNPASPAIGALDRSFGADAATVVDEGGEFVLGHRDNGVLTAVKHFPGHGSAGADSHKSLPDISKTWTIDELVPYRDLASQGLVDMAMSGHLEEKELSDGPDVPVSLSVKGIGALRAILGDGPVIITDDLEMDPIQARYSESEAAILAILAGNDILLHSTFDHIDPNIGPRLNRAIQDAVASGRIPQSRIEDSFARIVALKSRIGG
jgi:beta-N-acetylhexosaminidase